MFLRIDAAKCAVILATLVTWGPGKLVAQTPSELAAHKVYCAQMDATVRGRGAGKSYRHGLVNIQSCPAEAVVAALATQWSSPPSDSASAHLLGVVTGRMRDRRLLEPVMRAALNTALGKSQRLSAFYALTEYYDPNTVVVFRRVGEAGLSGPRYVLMGVIDHPGVDEGAQRLGPEVRREVLEVFNHLAQTDQDPTIRTIAGYLHSQLIAMQ